MKNQISSIHFIFTIYIPLWVLKNVNIRELTLTYFKGHRGNKGYAKLFFISGPNLQDYKQWPFNITYIVCPYTLDVPFEGFIDLWPLTYFLWLTCHLWCWPSDLTFCPDLWQRSIYRREASTLFRVPFNSNFIFPELVVIHGNCQFANTLYACCYFLTGQ